MRYQNNLAGHKIQCTICPRNCKLREGQCGFCHVRQNIDGHIVMTSYGYNTGLAIDPIEKKPLFHFYPGTKVLSFGTLGCNMGCQFCQNWQTTKSKIDVKTLNHNEPEEIAELALKYDCKSVAFTYNDPVVFFEYAVDTAIACQKKGIKTVAVTAGYINPEPRREFFQHMDAVNVDLKGFSEEFYQKNCLAHLEPVLDTLRYIKDKTRCWLEVTTLLIEGENDSDEMLTAECEWIAKHLGINVPIHFSAFHPDYKMLNKGITKISTLRRAYDIAKKAGLKYVYIGNVLDEATETTYCSNCSHPIIKRVGYEIVEYDLTNEGHCAFCYEECAGVFE